MYLKIIVNTVLIMLISVVQISFVSGLPGWFSSVNLVLVALIFILVLGGLKPSLVWAIGSGFLFDLFLFTPFGAYLFSLPLAVFVAYLILVNFLTNRSLYSFLAITFIAIAVHELILYLFSGSIIFISRQEVFLKFDVPFWLGKLGMFVVNLLAVFLIFYLMTFVSKNLKPVFLIRKKI